MHNIVIVTPYFVPHKWFVKAIDGAVRRGVSVEFCQKNGFIGC